MVHVIRVAQRLFIALVAVSIVLAGTTSAHASEHASDPNAEPTVADVRASLADADIATSSSVPTTSDSNSAVVATIEGGTIDVPRNPANPVEVAVDGQKVGFGIPSSDGDPAAKVGGDAAAFTAPDGTAQVVNVTGTPELPNLQFLTTYADANAPAVTRFPLDLPTGAHLRVEDDGSLTVLDSSNQVLVAAPAPWLKDANGVDIPNGAQYSIDGNTVVVTVALDQVTAFPAVSDPLWFVAAGAVLWGALRYALVHCGWGAATGVIGSLILNQRSVRDIVGNAAVGCVFGLIPNPLKRFVRRG